MSTISRAALHALYAVVKRVNAGDLSIQRGVDILADQHNVNRNSATDYIRNYVHLIRGERFMRTINTYVTEYFLTQIFKDGGASTFFNALQSLRQHIDYYEGLGKGRLKKLRTIYEEFCIMLDEHQVRSNPQSRYFFQYWLEPQLDIELVLKALLVHSGSNQFDCVLPEDVVWIVSVRHRGEMQLVGPILVDRVVDKEEAIRRFGPSVWDASHYIIAKDGTETQIREKSFEEIALQLRFISPTGRDRLIVIDGRVDGKELQQLRRLIVESVDLLYSIWFGGHADAAGCA